MNLSNFNKKNTIRTNMRQATVFFRKGEVNPRKAQLTILIVPMHIIQRGNNRQTYFYADENYQFHSQWQEKYTQEYDSSVHICMLMTNNVYLLITPQSAEDPGFLMKRHEQRYVKYINRTCHRSDRVRVNMIEHPAEYPSIEQLFRKCAGKIITATNDNYALDNERFQKKIASALGCRVMPGKTKEIA